MKLLLYSTIVLITINNFAKSWRPFNILMTYGNCFTNSTIISHVNCSVDTDVHKGGLSLHLMFTDDVPKPTLDVLIAMRRIAQPDFILVNMTALNACKFFENRELMQMLKLIRQEINLYSDNFPRQCPLKKDSRIDVKNMFFKEDNLPSYAPECNFTVKMKLWSVKEKLVDLTIFGIIENKNKIKKRTKLTKTNN